MKEDFPGSVGQLRIGMKFRQRKLTLHERDGALVCVLQQPLAGPEAQPEQRVPPAHMTVQFLSRRLDTGALVHACMHA
jgi:hypothetical protein